MPELTNLTDRISHLRDSKTGSRIISGDQHSNGPDKPKSKKKKVKVKSANWAERRMATDYFMIFVYALLGISMCCQIGCILWLDL